MGSRSQKRGTAFGSKHKLCSRTRLARERSRPQKYGSSIIDGNATVHQGNQYIINKVQIIAAYERLQDQLGLPTIEEVRALRGETVIEVPQNVAGTWSNKISPFAKTKNNSESPCLSARNFRTNKLHTNGDKDPEQPVISQDSNHYSTNKDTDAQATLVFKFFKLVARSFSLPSPLSLPSFSKVKPNTSFSASHSSPTIDDDSDNLQTQVQKQEHVPVELLVFLVAVTPFIVDRRLSISAFLSQCRQEPMVVLLATILFLGIWRYRFSIRIPSSPSFASGILLEDACGRPRLVSLDVCLDFSIFKHFLEFHYRETTSTVAEALIKAGQFHLMLGSRRGKVLMESNWDSSVFKPGYRIVNSVYISRDEAKCLRCTEPMTVTPMGEFHW